MSVMKRMLAVGVSFTFIMAQVLPAQSLSRTDEEMPPPPPPSSPVPPGSETPSYQTNWLGSANAHSCVSNPVGRLQAIQNYNTQSFVLGFNAPNLGVRYTRTTANIGPVKDLGTVASAGAVAIRAFLWNFGLAPIIDGAAGHWEVRGDDLWADGGQNHLQGMTFYHGNNPQVTPGTYALVTGSDWRGASPPGVGGDLFWVKFGSLPNVFYSPLTQPERGSRSNMVGGGYPNVNDRIFRHTVLNQTHAAAPPGVPYAGPSWHPGGPQFYHGVIAVPLEYADPLGENPATSSQVMFFDVGNNPENPTQIWPATIYKSGKAGAVALSRNNLGQWLVATYDNATVTVYKTVTADISSGWRFAAEARVGQDFPDPMISRFPGLGSIDSNAGQYQSLNFVNGCDGKLYLVGLNNSMMGFGTDFADVFEWEYSSAAQKYQFRKVLKVQMNGNSHFNDASGLYIGAGGEIRIYTAGGYRSDNLPVFTFREFVSP